MQLFLRKLSTASLAFSTLLLSSGCSKSRHETTETYYLVASNIKLPYWQSAFSGLKRGATELGVRAEFIGPDTYDPKQQRDRFRELLSKKPTGIMISAADPQLMKPEINAAIAAGIPVITMDSDAPGSRRLFFVGTNNYQAGLIGGRVLVKKLNGKGHVIVYTIPAQANLIERLRGYEDAIADSDIKILQTVDVRGDPALAFDSTMQIIKEGKVNVDGFVCLEATAGKEVAEVLERRNVQGKVVIAMDTDEQTLDWIQKGRIAATVAQKPFTMAYFGLRMLDDIHHNRPSKFDVDWSQELQAVVPAVIDTGAALIDQNNLEVMRKSAKPDTALFRFPGGLLGSIRGILPIHQPH
ncbi:MAG TPA: substrate-binding domain-containing protein [Bryobacteraceae bacterium]|nr:substrate-binding domain-containing protein [Bryobacteraceae bacterium]